MQQNQSATKRIFFYCAIFAAALLLLWLGHRSVTQDQQVFGKFSVAPVEQCVVDEVLYSYTKKYQIGQETQTYFLARITSGERKGETMRAQQVTDSFQAIPIKIVEAGDRVMLCYTNYGAGRTWIFQQYDRSMPILLLTGLFFLLLLIFGGKKGIATIASLCLTCAGIFYYFVPAILSGQNIYLSTLLSCSYIIAVTLVLVNGINLKSFSAAAGCLGGLLVSGTLFFVMDSFLRLTGMMDEESVYLTMMGIPFDLKAIIFASVLIGVLGGVLDVGVSIAASLHEIYPPGSAHQFSDIVRSGMNIGRDILCTMTNTLILVYIGGALSLTLLLTVYSNSLLELINRETITVEILQALLGSVGLVFTIPITTVFYALIATRYHPKAPTSLPEPKPLAVREYATQDHKETTPE